MSSLWMHILTACVLLASPTSAALPGVGSAPTGAASPTPDDAITVQHFTRCAVGVGVLVGAGVALYFGHVLPSLRFFELGAVLVGLHC